LVWVRMQRAQGGGRLTQKFRPWNGALDHMVDAACQNLSVGRMTELSAGVSFTWDRGRQRRDRPKTRGFARNSEGSRR
jgi:hypothetical protein